MTKDTGVPVTQADREDGGDAPWGYGWYDDGGKKHATGYLPTVDRLRDASSDAFPLYRHRLATTKAAVSDSSAAGEACQQDREAAIEFATRYLYPNSSGVQRALAELLARHRTTAVAAETERCARVAENTGTVIGYAKGSSIDGALTFAAAAIRAPSSGESK